MPSALRHLSKNAFLAAHKMLLPLGLMVLPKHYYVPFPDLRKLERNRERWTKKSEMRGISVDLDQQAQTMSAMVKPYFDEYRENRAYKEGVEGAFGPGFGRVEAMALHGVLRSLKPNRIIEVGSGISTYCMLAALEKNALEGRPGQIACIEPYPSSWLKGADVSLVQKEVQEVDANIVEDLDSGDLLFIDSTHTVQVDGDVNRIILELLPRLKSGVVVHFHDIYFPYDFNRDVLRSFNHWLETAMLHAFLIGNRRFEILFCLSQLHYERSDALRECFPDYEPKADINGLNAPNHAGDFPASIYLRVV